MTHPHRPRSAIGRMLERGSAYITHWSGSSWAFALALLTIVVWVVTGPFFGFSDTWQLVINTGTTVVTFLMVFLIQRAQNKESLAVQLKLNEIVAALEGASNRLIDIENLSEAELDVIHRHYHKLAEIAKHESDIRRSHSIEEARHRSRAGHKSRPRPAGAPPEAGAACEPPAGPRPPA
ncbi:low affinity iron permease family protein [Nannocystis pusilla]|uniref:Low affinity iron permease family protein n=1 Tax=Nannocystis pusilla TaxID=889268 RepID=A0ABS7TSY6_9BACT|nr:low affinity iron permease family protein [Nannocystis pusilla]MBZ5711337.1 low affinity iron permease family protein [Nannocystis pusilla]